MKILVENNQVFFELLRVEKGLGHGICLMFSVILCRLFL